MRAKTGFGGIPGIPTDDDGAAEEYLGKNKKEFSCLEASAVCRASGTIPPGFSPSLFAKTAAETTDSGKGEALLSLLGPSLEAGNKIFIFTQYAEMASLFSLS